MNKQEASSVFYHDIFDYPLKKSEISRWAVGKNFVLSRKIQVREKDGYYFVAGREENIEKRKKREKYSKRKLEIAKKASRVLRSIPTIRSVFVTGSLAMMNSGRGDDVDLMIITKKGTLWTTRALSYLLLFIRGFSFRTFGDKNQRDKVCLNIWMDESDLAWDKRSRNIYTAHEVAQVIPLVNKNKSYERFLWENGWIKDYWPSAIKIRNPNIEIRKGPSFVLRISCFVFMEIEPLARTLQYQYMKGKITRETVTKSCAIFHPIDRSKKVNKLFKLS